MNDFIEYVGDLSPVPDGYVVEVCRNNGRYDIAVAGVIEWKTVAAYRVMDSTKQTTKANDIQVAGDHYKSKAIQPWDFIASNRLGFFEGNIVKYVTRWESKGGVDDLRKAQHYLQKLIELQVKA